MSKFRATHTKWKRRKLIVRPRESAAEVAPSPGRQKVPDMANTGLRNQAGGLPASLPS